MILKIVASPSPYSHRRDAAGGEPSISARAASYDESNLAIRFMRPWTTWLNARTPDQSSLSEHLAPLYCDEKAGEKLNAFLEVHPIPTTLKKSHLLTL